MDITSPGNNHFPGFAAAGKFCSNHHVFAVYISTAERLFFVVGNIWSAERGRLSVSIIKELLKVKVNSKLRTFMKQIKTDKLFFNKKYKCKQEAIQDDQ